MVGDVGTGIACQNQLRSPLDGHQTVTRCDCIVVTRTTAPLHRQKAVQHRCALRVLVPTLDGGLRDLRSELAIVPDASDGITVVLSLSYI